MRVASLSSMSIHAVTTRFMDARACVNEDAGWLKLGMESVVVARVSAKGAMVIIVIIIPQTMHPPAHTVHKKTLRRGEHPLG